MGNKYSVTADPSRRRLWMPPLEADPPEPTTCRPLVADEELPLLLVVGENRILPDEEEGEGDRLSGPTPSVYASAVHGQDVDEDPVMASRTIAAAVTTFDDDGVDRSMLFHALLSGQKPFDCLLIQ